MDKTELLALADDIASVRFSGSITDVTIAQKLDEWSGRLRLAAAEPGEPVAWPANLHPNTLDLVKRFAVALAKKLRLAEEKYGYSDDWVDDDWEAVCRDHLYRHLEKGDPRDVAAYCAFMWHHGWITHPKPAPAFGDGYDPTCQPYDEPFRHAVSSVWQQLLDKDDRTSPEEYPNMALITFDEFKEALTQLRAPADQNAERMRDALIALDERLRPCGSLSTAEDAYDSFYQEIVSEALTAAQGADGEKSDGGKKETAVTEDQIKYMVDRFLSWKLPRDTFNPDCGISFDKKPFNAHTPHPMLYEPSGTNLFDAEQATAMVRYMIDGMTGPSDRPADVTVEDLTKLMLETCNQIWKHEAGQIARALLDAYEIRRR